jgi:hypothetical protein
MSFGAVQFRAVEFRTERPIMMPAASLRSGRTSVTADAVRGGRQRFPKVGFADGAPLQPASRVVQRAKAILGSTRELSQEVPAVEDFHYVAFAGPLGTSAAGWRMELEPMDDERTDAMMWIEMELRTVMRAIFRELFESRIQRVSDIEMIAIKAAVESTTPAGTS